LVIQIKICIKRKGFAVAFFGVPHPTAPHFPNQLRQASSIRDKWE
jgi:hypothetical protein